MPRSLLAVLSVLLSLSIATPGYAYVFGTGEGPGRMTKRTVTTTAESMNSPRTSLRFWSRTRRMADDSSLSGRQSLERSHLRRFRRLNRQPKEGSDRYRILNLQSSDVFKMNRREIRRIMDESSLPPRLVQTGAASMVDRPSRRAIWSAAELQ